MNSAPTAWLLSLLSAALLILSFPPYSLPPLAFVALAPLARAASRAKDWRQAANLGAACGLVFYGTGLSWLARIFGPQAAAFWCIFALWIALNTGFFRWAFLRWGDSWKTVLAAAALWTGAEYFRCEVWFLNNAWLALGFSQTGAMQQAAAWIGVYGLSFLAAAAGSALAINPRKAAAVGAACLVLALGGAWRMRAYDDGGRPLKVALIQDESIDLLRMAKLASQGPAREADLLVWPEDSVRFFPGYQDLVLRPLRQQLKGSGTTAVVGMYACPDDFEVTEGWFNQAWVISPSGELLGVYDKHHPIPFVERHLKPNPDPRPVETALGRLGVQICYDFDFEDGARKLARAGAELLVVPDMDPLEWGIKQHLQHSAMAPMRSVECGLWTVRAASSGESQIIDPLGRVRARLEAGKSGVLAGQARLVRARTVYTACGWVLGPLCLAAALLLLALAGWSGWQNAVKLAP